MPNANHQIALVQNPAGKFSGSDFKLKKTPIPKPKKGQFLVRNLYLSLDPANRLWASPYASYTPPVGLGEVMRGFTVSEVIESKHPKFKAGDIVQGMDGWQEYAISDGVNYNEEGKVDTWNMKAVVKAGLPISAGLSVLGTTGLAAYVGLLTTCHPKRGETVLVSGAAGATGSIAGQLAKIKGCRAVGIAGSDEKCKILRKEFGFDAAINYKTQDLDKAIAKTCPKGVDIYFDNVGGDMLNIALTHINDHARVSICGAISQYTTLEKGIQGPSNYGYLLFKRARMEGFIVLDHYIKDRDKMVADMIRWIKAGKIHYRDEIVNGLAKAPKVINRLYDGRNMGKLTVKIGEEPAAPVKPKRKAAKKSAKKPKRKAAKAKRR